MDQKKGLGVARFTSVLLVVALCVTNIVQSCKPLSEIMVKNEVLKNNNNKVNSNSNNNNSNNESCMSALPTGDILSTVLCVCNHSDAYYKSERTLVKDHLQVVFDTHITRPTSPNDNYSSNNILDPNNGTKIKKKRKRTLFRWNINPWNATPSTMSTTSPPTSSLLPLITVWNNGGLFDHGSDFWAEHGAHLFHFTEILISSWLQINRYIPKFMDQTNSYANTMRRRWKMNERVQHFVLSSVNPSEYWLKNFKNHNGYLFGKVFPNARLWLQNDVLLAPDSDVLFHPPQSNNNEVICMRGPPKLTDPTVEVHNWDDVWDDEHRLVNVQPSKLNKLIHPWMREFDADEWYEMIWNNNNNNNPTSNSPLPWVDDWRVRTYQESTTRQKIVVTYVDRQNTGRKLPDEWHLALLSEFQANEDNKYPHVEFIHAHMEDMSFPDQMNLAHQTDLLIGVHGNGLTHELFMVPRKYVLEIYPHDQEYEFDYWMYAKIMGHTYVLLDGNRGLVDVTENFLPEKLLTRNRGSIQNPMDTTPLLLGIRAMVSRAGQELLV